MSKTFRTKHLFQKYLDNACSEPELEELFNLLDDEANLKSIEELLEGLWINIPASSNPLADRVELYSKFRKRTQRKQELYAYKKKSPSYLRWVAAACLTILVGLATYILLPTGDSEAGSSLVEHKMPHVNPALQRILLSDGSTVVLNKGSHLDYPEKFGPKSREVFLTGEGYFDINHDASRPFLVHTGKITTRVLGTAFNIKNGAKDDRIVVTVTRGKVAVSDPLKTLAVLLPNEQISYSPTSHKLQKAAINSKVVTLWKEEDLALDNVELQTAVKLIGERYGASIILENQKIKNCRFTAYFLNTTSIQQVIAVISKLNNLEVKNHSEGTYTLSGTGCE